MRARWIVLAMAILLLGAAGGALLAPQPADAVSREIIQLQQQVNLLLQGQQDLRTTVDSDNAVLKTMIQQSTAAINQLNTTMGSLQKAVQDGQANSGSRLDSLTQQIQAISDNLQDVQARTGKLSQQLTDIQSTLQSIDAKVSGGGAAAPGGMNPPGDSGNPSATSNAAGGSGRAVASGPPISADVLYTNAQRDLNRGNYDLARQEFNDYLHYFGDSDLASNAQFYLGEIAYAKGDYHGAVGAYDRVIVNYPKSFKLAAAILRKGDALLKLGQRSNAIREYREVVRRFPGTEESRRAQAKIHRLSSS